MEDKEYTCDYCGDRFWVPAKRIYESSDVVFCRKRCYLRYMEQWGDEVNAELMDILPGGWDEE